MYVNDYGEAILCTVEIVNNRNSCKLSDQVNEMKQANEVLC